MNHLKQYVAKKKSVVPVYLVNNNNVCVGFPGGSVVKNPPANAGDAGSVPDSGISPGKNGNPLQYSCLGNPMDRGAWWAPSLWGCQRVEHGLRTKQQQMYMCKLLSLFQNKAATLYFTFLYLFNYCKKDGPA